LLALVVAAPALASSDVFGNVAPVSPVPAALAERYPLGNYALDAHFPAVKASLTGGVDASGVAPTIAHFLANTLWLLTAFLADTLVTLFGFAFSLDLVRGSEATGGAGALAPVGEAIRALYADVLGAPWLVAAITVTGIWAIWRGLVQRRYTETAGALGLSLLYIVVALAFVTQPERTVGEAVRWTNQLSLAFLSLSTAGDTSGAEGAKRAAADQLFSLLVYEPWAVLQFGGREHCVRPGTGSADDNPVSVPVRPLARDAASDAELARRLAAGIEVRVPGKTCISDRNKYAPHFLRFAPGSEERDTEYEALNEGDPSKLHDADRRGGYRLGVADKPAADAMEQGGQYQRLLLALVVFAGELGAFLLLGALCIGVTFAQVLLLLLLAFAPVALVFATIPGRGHDFFQGWLTRLAGFLLRKAAYSLILAVLLAVNAALAQATSNLGWLLSFGLQALLFWAVFLYRRQLTGQLLGATAGRGEVTEAGRFAALYHTSRLATRRLGSTVAPRRWPGRHHRPAPDDLPERPPTPPAAVTSLQPTAPDAAASEQAAHPAFTRGETQPHAHTQSVPAGGLERGDERGGFAVAQPGPSDRVQELPAGREAAPDEQSPARPRRSQPGDQSPGRDDPPADPPERPRRHDNPLQSELKADRRRLNEADRASTTEDSEEPRR
jgi:hypothetical protein